MLAHKTCIRYLETLRLGVGETTLVLYKLGYFYIVIRGESDIN